MNTKSIINRMILMLLVSIAVACVKVGDGFVGTVEEQKIAQSGPAYAAQFSNFFDVEVNITSQYANGRFYSIYTDYPYSDDGDLLGTPLLTGCTPIHETINVPSGVEKLYVLNDAGVKEYSVSDFSTGDALNISDTDSRSAISRADEGGAMNEAKLNEAIRLVNNQFLPEKRFNIRGEELYKCSDLHIKDLTGNQTASVWLTLIKYDIAGMMWYYTYTKENPSIGDCTFYGVNNGTVQKLEFSDVKRGAFPLVECKTENIKHEIELPSSTLTNNIYVGFVFWGNTGGLKFTTPSLNIKGLAYTDADSNGDYIDTTIDYGSGRKFTIKKNITSGVICHFESFGSQYNVVGMENRLPNQTSSSYDGDYNDMVLLLRSDPRYVTPSVNIGLTSPSITVFREGFWIFEDNFPEEGDFDFNDVVVAYSAEKVDGVMNIVCKLMAKGCDNHNEVGLMILKNNIDDDAWKNPVEQKKLWDNISGYFNVNDGVLDFTDESCPKTEVTFNCDDFNLLRPYLKSNGSLITMETYNTDDFPYALDIPSFGSNKNNTWFRWSIEGHSIDESYVFKVKNRSPSWYYNSELRDKNDSYVIKRQQNESVW